MALNSFKDSLNRKALHHNWTHYRTVRPWWFLVAAIVSALVCVFALRANNLGMVELRSTVYTADKAGKDVEQPLRKLRSYVYAHMNTALASGRNAVHPPIQLKYTYERLVAKENARVVKANSEIYSDAQKYCEAAVPVGFSGRYRLTCVQQYVTTHGTKSQPIPKNIYQFDFVSPKWSPDLAGLSMVFTGVFLLAAILLWLGELIIRKLLKV